eukprot:gene11176-18789_t
MAEFELTIQILQGDDPIFTKPKLAEKYLLKPPFRFLHDVISAVQAGTGFAPGLYSGDELDAKAIQDKEQKVAFLGKMIDVVSIVAGQAVPAKPLKIVAGLEPENTNIFLQMLGRACRQSNGADAVAQVLNGGGGEVDPPAASHPPAAAPEAATPAEEKKKRSSKDGGRRAKPPVEEPPAPDNEEAPPPKLKSKSRSKPPPAEDAAPPDPPARAASPAENQDAMNSSQGARVLAYRQSPRMALPKLPSSNTASASLLAGGARVLARPQSARKAPPKLPSSNTASASLVAGVRSSGAGAGRRAPGNPGADWKPEEKGWLPGRLPGGKGWLPGGKGWLPGWPQADWKPGGRGGSPAEDAAENSDDDVDVGAAAGAANKPVALFEEGAVNNIDDDGAAAGAANKPVALFEEGAVDNIDDDGATDMLVALFEEGAADNSDDDVEGAAAGAANKPVALLKEGAADNGDDIVDVVHAAGAANKPVALLKEGAADNSDDDVEGAAAGAANKPVALFEEGAADNSDDDVEVVHEARSVALGPRGEDGAEKGVLVKDILEAEEELKKAGAEAAVDENEEPQNTGIILKRKGSMARGGGAGAAAHAAGASHPIKANDLQGIRELVQRLCQSSNPLAKSMDYLAEDIENMSKEYRFWVTERRVFQERLDEEQRLGTNKEDIENMSKEYRFWVTERRVFQERLDEEQRLGSNIEKHDAQLADLDSQKHDAQLADLDSQVKQVQDRIVGVKGSILRNDETINNLLGMAVGK